MTFQFLKFEVNAWRDHDDVSHWFAAGSIADSGAPVE